jgi:3-oxoadipate enol-lactonase
MPTVDVPGAALYYEIHGAGPWLVFAHGAGGNHLSWWQQVPAFAGRFRCLVYDQRGWGRSVCDGTPDPARFAPDLAVLLDHVGAERAALVGQSMGGWTALGCALGMPERVTHLVLAATLAGLTDAAILARLAAIHGRGRPFDGRRALAPDFPMRDPARTFLYEEIAASNPPLAPAFLGALIALRYPAARERLRMPTTFIAGGRDQLFPPDVVSMAHARLPGAALVVVPEAGHSAYFECPEEFNRALATALVAG